MAILLVDDEASTREALRTLLARMTSEPVLEAKNGEEALKMLDASNSRVRMIIADWEMPYLDGIGLLKAVAGRPELDLAPFLLITSDLPGSRLELFHRENPRLDAHLLKPFRLKALEEAMVRAARHRAASRDTIVVCAIENAPVVAQIRKAASQRKDGILKTIVCASDEAALKEALEAHARTVGSVWLDPASVPGLRESWVSAFKKTPLGAVTPLVCLSRDPRAIREVRTQCQFFVKAPTGAEAERHWVSLLDALESRALQSRETESLAVAAKSALQAKNYKEARKHALKLLELDPQNAEGEVVAAEACERAGHREDAIMHYRSATTINPCAPRPYIKLLELLAAEAKAQAEQRLVAETAVEFCPNSVDVLLAAARAWSAAGERARSVETLNRVLSINPKHEGARELLAALGAR